MQWLDDLKWYNNTTGKLRIFNKFGNPLGLHSILRLRVTTLTKIDAKACMRHSGLIGATGFNTAVNYKL